ncbi:MAG: DUF1194 domain-containing protein [Candidatus Kaistia colombiensis]|nr:MAG: DUF1194 domain-containing protein [Kaistia sp.]
MCPESLSIAYSAKRIIKLSIISATFLCLALLRAGEGLAQTVNPVDLQLVIALDVSTSMDLDERTLQRDGFAAAFREPDIVRAIQRGPNRRIAVAVLEWAGETRQNVILDWTEIADAASASDFADRIERRIPGRMALGTAIGAAMLRAAVLFGESPFDGGRRVINISGDGINNRGPEPAIVRDRLVARGITINGLPIVYKTMLEGVVDGKDGRQPRPGELAAYFERQVVGGYGAFVEPVFSKRDYARAIRKKLLREIHGPDQLAANWHPEDGWPSR